MSVLATVCRVLFSWKVSSSFELDNIERVRQVVLPVPCPRAGVAEVGNLVLSLATRKI